MRNISAKFILAASGLLLQQQALAQCAATLPGGAASNMFTQIRNSTSPVAADKNLNTVVFIHRNNAGAFGGNSGNLRYDVSTNGGLSWTNDQGVLNPLNTSLARYPSVAIYNPTLNINPSNAYLSYVAATINNVSAWNGMVSGVRQLNGAGTTESYNQPAAPSPFIPHSVSKGAPGVFWAADAQFNGSFITGYNIYKGVWNGTNDIGWVTNFTVTPPFNIAYNGIANVGDYNIAFDPTGTIGWFSFLGHVTPGPANYAYYPVFYKTTDGGLTWNGPIQVDLNGMSCLMSNITPGNIVTANLEHDLVVDVNGNPHFLTTICNGASSYSIFYNAWHHMYDITQVNGVWTAYDIANVNAGRGSWGVSPNVATMDMAPQAARSADGTKVFFTWSDNATYLQGAANVQPDLFGKGFDVVNKQWTLVKNFTACNPSTSGLILFPHTASEVLEPSANNYKLATVYGEYTAGNDPINVSNFRFLDNLTFANTDFSTFQSPAAVSIVQGTNILACPGTSVTLSITGQYESVLWSNGTTTTTNSVSTPGQYIVTAMAGCNIGIDTITVTGLTTTLSLSSPTICAGSSVTLSVAGNANSYAWTPGTTTGTVLTASPAVTTVYYLAATGDQGCTNTTSTTVVVNPAPTLTVAGSGSVCAGSAITQTASGAVSYVWNGSAAGATISLTPSVTTVYTVSGTDANACVGTATVSVMVSPAPSLTFSASRATICAGETTTLSANGASSFTVAGPSLSMTIISSPPTNSGSISNVISPTVSGGYTVTGTSVDGCAAQAMVSISVSACTGLTSLETHDGFELLAFPNPNQGDFFLSAPGDIDLQIVNEVGQLVRTVALNQQNDHHAEVSRLSSGIYFIVGSHNNQAVRQKIAILK